MTCNCFYTLGCVRFRFSISLKAYSCLVFGITVKQVTDLKYLFTPSVHCLSTAYSDHNSCGRYHWCSATTLVTRTRFDLILSRCECQDKQQGYVYPTALVRAENNYAVLKQESSSSTSSKQSEEPRPVFVKLIGLLQWVLRSANVRPKCNLTAESTISISDIGLWGTEMSGLGTLSA